MTELCIARGRDVGLCLDDEPLCGVTHFSAVSRRESHELYEYLSGTPYDTVPVSESHELVVTVLSLFADAVPEDRSFTLSVAQGDTEYRYHGCTVVRRERDIRGDQAVTDRYTVKAARMQKRRTEHAG